MVQEGATTYKTVYSKFLTTTGLKSASNYFCLNFEQPKSPDLNKRYNEAKKIFDYYMKT